VLSETRKKKRIRSNWRMGELQKASVERQEIKREVHEIRPVGRKEMSEREVGRGTGRRRSKGQKVKSSALNFTSETNKAGLPERDGDLSNPRSDASISWKIWGKTARRRRKPGRQEGR